MPDKNSDELDRSIVRHSKAEDAHVVTEPLEIAAQEARNAVLQSEQVRQYILQSIDRGQFRLRQSVILALNRSAIDGLSSYAGVWRPGKVEIGKSKHFPPDAHLVPELVEELCDYVNENWSTSSAVHLCSMVMWRMNWIHPFTDGNGRTSRAVAYIVLSAKSNVLLPGSVTITDQIIEYRKPYYDALEAADMAYNMSKSLNLSTVIGMEQLIASMLAKQLTTYFDNANGR